MAGTFLEVNGKNEQVVSSGKYVVITKLATLGDSLTPPTVVEGGPLILRNNVMAVDWKTESSEASKATFGGDLTVTQTSNGKADITFAEMIVPVIKYLWPDTNVEAVTDLLGIDASVVPAAHVQVTTYDNLSNGKQRVLKFMDLEIPFAGLATKAMSGKSASQTDDVTVSCTVNRCEHPYGGVTGAVYVKTEKYTAEQLQKYLLSVDPTVDAKAVL